MNRERRAEQRQESEDRRRGREFRLIIPRELREGWLALQGRTEKLRLTPIPDGWQHLSDEELSRLVSLASQRSTSIS